MNENNNTCGIESCDNEAEYFDEMDNRICEEHMQQDMEETGNDPSCYEKMEHGEPKEETPPWTDLKSSNLKRARYNPDDETIDIEFHKSGIYRYYKTNQRLFLALCGDGSPGKFFAKHIRNEYKNKKINLKEKKGDDKK